MPTARPAPHAPAAPIRAARRDDAFAIVRWPLSARLALAGLVSAAVWWAVLAVIR